jgi:hypothetical protein
MLAGGPNPKRFASQMPIQHKSTTRQAFWAQPTAATNSGEDSTTGYTMRGGTSATGSCRLCKVDTTFNHTNHNHHNHHTNRTNHHNHHNHTNHTNQIGHMVEMSIQTTSL